MPGGHGTRREMRNDTVLQWVKQSARECELILSVCSGALILANAGLLDGLRATTHRGALDELRAAAPNTVVAPTELITTEHESESPLRATASAPQSFMNPDEVIQPNRSNHIQSSLQMSHDNDRPEQRLEKRIQGLVTEAH